MPMDSSLRLKSTARVAIAAGLASTIGCASAPLAEQPKSGVVSRCEPGEMMLDSGACVPSHQKVQCPGGMVPNARSDDCEIDLQTWTTAAFGADNGPGKQQFCSSLASNPVVFGLNPGDGKMLSIRVQIWMAKSRDAKSARAHIDEATNNGVPVSYEGRMLIERSATNMLTDLTDRVGVASAVKGEVTVKCWVPYTAVRRDTTIDDSKYERPVLVLPSPMRPDPPSSPGPIVRQNPPSTSIPDTPPPSW